MGNQDVNLKPKQNAVSGESSSSRVDLFSGEHTTTIVVAILFLVVFIGLIIYLIAKEKYENLVLNGLFSLLSLLGGFFAGSQLKKK
jgi:hypothetical protein